jgi:hypothetical protein
VLVDLVSPVLADVTHRFELQRDDREVGSDRNSWDRKCAEHRAEHRVLEYVLIDLLLAPRRVGDRFDVAGEQGVLRLVQQVRSSCSTANYRRDRFGV